MSVSEAPLVSIVYRRDSLGLIAASICWPAASSKAAAWNGCSVGIAAVSDGYHFRAHSLSAAESVAGGVRPLMSYSSGSSMRPG